MRRYEYLVVTHVGLANCVVDTENGQPVCGDDPLSYERRRLAEGWEPYECSRKDLLVILGRATWNTTRAREELGKENAGAWSVYRRLVG